RDGMVAVLDRVGALALVLPAIDRPGGLARRETGFVQPQSRDHALHQPLLVVGIENLEAFRQAGLAPVPAQQAVGDAVEGTHGEPLRAAGNQRLQPRAHLARGLVGEGDGEDRPRRYALHLGEPADAAREHAGLAGAGAGEDEVVAGRGADGFALRVVERVDQVRDIHRTHCSGCGAQPFLKKPPMASSAPTTMPAIPSHCGKALSWVAVSLAEPNCTRVSVVW